MATASALSLRGERTQRRVLIVDDSSVARAVLTRIVEDAGVFVSAAVADVNAALDFLRAGTVDVILLDLDMPDIDGLTGLPDLIAAGAGAKVLVVSSAAAEGAAASVQALALGAADTMVKPGRNICSGSFALTLIEKLARLADRAGPVARRGRPADLPRRDFDLVAIGASTGGIHAISSVLRDLPTSFRTPIVITQHLPPTFVPYFVGQLAAATGRPCEIASDRLTLREHMIVVAPGDAHLVGVPLPGGRAAARLCRTPVANGNMPSLDPMFASFAHCFGARLLAVVLTGMGRDGLDGARDVRAAGGSVIVQDQASSVVWGMPGAVAAAGLADAILSPAEIGSLIAATSAAA